MEDASFSSPLENPWVQKTVESVIKITQTSVLNWCNIVVKMGMDQTDQDQWASIFIGHVKSLFKDMIAEVKLHQNTLCDEIETLLKKSTALCKDLHIKMPVYGSQCLSLYQERRLLNERIQEYEKLAEEKRKEIAVLSKQQLKLCRSLGRSPKQILDSPLPTPEFISEFKNYLDSLESEKFEREEKFLQKKTLMLELVEELNYQPTLDFEKAVISSDDALFLVTDNNMTELNHFHELLQQQLDDTKDEIGNLRERIKFLWEILAENLKDCDEFLQKHTGHSLHTLEALRQEVNRCEALKRANIEVFVKRLRNDLVNWWDKCHLTDEEREEFYYFNNDLYTEDLLTLHDLEIQKLKTYYSENSELFHLLEKRQKLWDKMLIQEERATAPDRYKNRGGQLLKEEKERNALSKDIPKIEDRLFQLANSFEIRTGKKFLSWGKTLESIVLQAHEKRDQERKLKLSARKQKRDQTITPAKLGLTSCTSTQQLALLVSNAGSAKRKIITPLFPSKRTRTFHEKNVPQTAPPKLAINGRLVGRSRYSIERAKRIQKCRRISQRALQKRLDKENSSTCSGEYDLFEKEIQNREGWRSTIFLEAGSSETDHLAVPLPVTPQPATPRRLQGTNSYKSHSPRTGTPRTGAKLATAPSLKLLF